MATFDERVRLMADGRFKPSTVTFPFIGDDVEVGVRLLHDKEIDECRLDAVKWVGERAKSIGMDAGDLLRIEPELLDREQRRRILYRAFLDVDTICDGAEPKRFFKAAGQVETLDPLTIDTLFELYLQQQNRMDPFAGLDEDACEGLVDYLGKASKDPGEGPTVGQVLATFDAPTLRRLLRFSVARQSS